MSLLDIFGVVIMALGCGVTASAFLRRGSVAWDPSPAVHPLALDDGPWPPDPWSAVPSDDGAARAFAQEGEMPATMVLLANLLDADKVPDVERQAQAMAVVASPTHHGRHAFVEAALAIAGVVKPKSTADQENHDAIQTAVQADLGGSAKLIWPNPGSPFDPRFHRTFPPVPAGRRATVRTLSACGFRETDYVARAWVEVTPTS